MAAGTAAVEEQLLAEESSLWELPKLWTAVQQLAATGVGRWQLVVKVAQLLKVSMQAQEEAHQTMQPCCRYKKMWCQLTSVYMVVSLEKSLTMQ